MSLGTAQVQHKPSQYWGEWDNCSFSVKAIIPSENVCQNTKARGLLSHHRRAQSYFIVGHQGLKLFSSYKSITSMAVFVSSLV
jgi:hypothetical protein